MSSPPEVLEDEQEINNGEGEQERGASEDDAGVVEPETADRRTVTAPLPLDWTRINKERETEEKVVRYPWTVSDIDIEDDELCIVGTAGKKVTNMGKLGEHCNPKLKKLILRSNLVKTMEGLGDFEELELLELYDNMVDALSALDEGPNGAPGNTLQVLDMSYNVIRDMRPVSLCRNLRELYLANNKLRTIDGLSELKSLVKIDLGANKIRVMEGFHGLVNLEELWLGKNKIEMIQGIEKLTKLRRLDVQSNRLTVVTNLESQKDTLEELYLGHNGITNEGASDPTGLALNFTQLLTLDLSRNFLTSTEPLAHLVGLNDLWLSGNKIVTFDQISHLSTLTVLDASTSSTILWQANLSTARS
ncbi:Leucine Rich repeats (2 copies) [Fragilaria crotonensis]|nr:Leucine Rich repeats (2 copies) [Fragilaria crotonensis]